MALVGVLVICIPWMLVVRPAVLYMRNKEQMKNAPTIKQVTVR